ncbi:hypothetical protein ACL7TT_11550 [Microbulbifer sp. 2304DJ12-6]|uniref:hypothetical protein n=1 Tax=Microbulbifer sp. 2304DJ12-6 TaxID=3233340 RepID=UPI0039B0BC1C
MNESSPPRARLLVELPDERFEVEVPSGRKPSVGDIVELDQGFTGKNGLPMALVFCPDENGGDLYEAEVYEAEIEVLEKK